MRWAWVLAGWTAVVWGARISTILDDGGGAVSLLVPAVLVALAVAAGAHAATRRLAWAPPALAVATVAVWVVRAPLVLAHDHPAAFKAVHLVLALLSIGLALVVAVWRRPGAVSGAEGGRPDRRRVRG